jgi:sterol desaturase/sphingolipid hydroxylase (fatty acid hydroxylase superfamily)
LLVGPAFHRRHHAIGYGHEGTKYGCNFGVLFPWWDMLFRSVSWSREIEPTGIRDQIAAPGVRAVNYGEGFFEQHWLAFKRIGARLSARRTTGRGNSDTDAAAV